MLDDAFEERISGQRGRGGGKKMFARAFTMYVLNWGGTRAKTKEKAPGGKKESLARGRES